MRGFSLGAVVYAGDFRDLARTRNEKKYCTSTSHLEVMGDLTLGCGAKFDKSSSQSFLSGFFLFLSLLLTHSVTY